MTDRTAQPWVSVASDYAVLHAGDWMFYYGYESTEREPDEDDNVGDWCFEARRITDGVRSVTVKAPWRKLGSPSQWNVERNLLMGIGWMVTRGYLAAHP